jgi:selenocysteine lyase/cysteine desulfurase
VREAIERHSRELDSNAARYLRQSEVVLEDKARAAAARYLDSKPEQVALTDSTTMGLGLVYARLKLEPGDEVLTTAHDFYSTHEALRLRAQLDGVKVRRIRLYDEPTRSAARYTRRCSRAASSRRTQRASPSSTPQHSSSSPTGRKRPRTWSRPCAQRRGATRTTAD